MDNVLAPGQPVVNLDSTISGSLEHIGNAHGIRQGASCQLIFYAIHLEFKWYRNVLVTKIPFRDQLASHFKTETLALRAWTKQNTWL